MARGRKLLSPPVYLRPMMGKVKEAVYSTLTSFGLYDATSFQTGNHRHMGQPVRHLDIFAGSGSVGLESLSRGASHCTFVDLSTECCTCIQRNLEWTGLVRDDDHDSNDDNSNRHNIGTKDPLQQPQKRTALVCAADALVALREPQAVGIPAGSKYQIVTLCPPYEEVVYGELLEAVVGSTLVADNDAVVILEYPVELWGKFPHVLTVDNHTAVGVRNRRYGRTVIAMYVINPSGALSDAANSRPEEFVCL